jgi:CheY-like chemotaxis protein
MAKAKNRAALVVEDDPIVAMATEEILRSEGFDPVETCATAKAAIERLAALAPRLMVLDAGLADRDDGWSIAELAREIVSPPPKLLFVTGSPDAIPVEIAKLGTVLAKPCSEEDLRAAIRTI